MYNSKRILATICARGGSKGIPGKNIKMLAGKPLIAHSIDTALQSKLIDRVIVSTDDAAIKKIAKKFGAEVPFVRPAELANDKIGRIAAVIHAVEQAQKIYKEKYDVIVDLGNVSPLRNQEDIEGTIKLLLDNPETDVVYTVAEADRNPYYNMIEVGSDGYSHLVKQISPSPSCRQDAPKVYSMNDSVYAIRSSTLLANKHQTVPIQLWENVKHRLFIMPRERSIDIDSPLDFQLIEAMMVGQK